MLLRIMLGFRFLEFRVVGFRVLHAYFCIGAPKKRERLATKTPKPET